MGGKFTSWDTTETVTKNDVREFAFCFFLKSGSVITLENSGKGHIGYTLALKRVLFPKGRSGKYVWGRGVAAMEPE